jgi:hypothetical protein
MRFKGMRAASQWPLLHHELLYLEAKKIGKPVCFYMQIDRGL